MKKLILIGLLLSFFNAFSQNDPQKMIDEFFNLYKNKSTDAALDYLFGTNKWMSASQDQIESVKFKLNSTVVKSMGSCFGYDLITKKTVGDKLIFYSYLIKYDMQPLRFKFLFYNPNGDWRLQTFSFDDKIKEELEEGAKVYRLKENLEY
ncbi:MAG: hypothetical protein U0289_17770 [Cyclobacteriaceae bacterium]|jgi:hypothetical protein|nr:hypothetical protein [Cytophagales bacterium]HNP78540.1 hypothetical protein [Cyclobacteriaceae bacterium]